MPTAHPRIAITRDPELDEALDRVARLLSHDVPVARLVRDLALRGAQALELEDAESRTRRRAFAERIGSDQPPWDGDVLERVEELSG